MFVLLVVPEPELSFQALQAGTGAGVPSAPSAKSSLVLEGKILIPEGSQQRHCPAGWETLLGQLSLNPLHENMEKKESQSEAVGAFGCSLHLRAAAGMARKDPGSVSSPLLSELSQWNVGAAGNCVGSHPGS